MGIQYNPRAVTSGLVLALDAGNTKSYPGSGTAWTDLSGRGNTGTLQNSPTYSSANGGSLAFNGTSNYIDLGNPSSLNILGTVTVNAWVNANVINSGVNVWYTIFEKGYDGSFDQLYFRFTEGQLQIGSYRQSDLTNFSTTYTGLTVNTWYNLVGQYNGTSWIIYVNGAQVASTTTTGILASTAPCGIGAAYISTGYARFFNGKISQVSVYNRALSATEISQNFNALRGRYRI
jgi:hypothetical protein